MLEAWESIVVRVYRIKIWFYSMDLDIHADMYNNI